MKGLHIQKKSFDGYCVGQGVEYPGIIIHAKSDEELKKEFLKALPGHQKALTKISQDTEIEVIQIDTIPVAE